MDTFASKIIIKLPDLTKMNFINLS